MNISRICMIFVLNLTFCTIFGESNVQFETTAIDTNTQQLRLTIPLARGEYIYADTISLSVDKPGITLSKWTSSIDHVIRYDQQYRTSKRVIQGKPVLTVAVSRITDAPIRDASLRLTYHTNKGKTAFESIFPLSFWAPVQEPIAESKGSPQNQSLAQETSSEEPSAMTAPEATQEQPAEQKQVTVITNGWSQSLSSAIKGSHSLWIQLLLAILLGLLMSLTPCIYPMIPITMGILQAQGSRSIGRNFLLALSYTMGIATTFALLGLAAAFAGHLMSSLLMNPFVIIFVIALLLYVAGSLFGFYELYIPRNLTNRNHGTISSGNIATAFFFGAVSGSIASPCLSPGIIFMLTLVAALKNIFAGFALLFAFGIGLSIPLLLIGIFSSSITMLPRAGSWMEEIKYIFGFMMLGMCCYFLASIAPWYIVQAIIALLILASGLFYLIHSRKLSGWGNRASNILGMLLIAGSVVVAANAMKTFFMPALEVSSVDWQNDYDKALSIARQEQKKLFVFVHAPLCIACDKLEHKFNSNQRFITAIKRWVPVSINLRNQTESTKQFINKFNIVGAPNCILIDPSNESVIQRWDYELSKERCSQLLSVIEAI